MTPSLLQDVREILIRKGLDDPYISDKMSRFENVRTNLEVLALASFLDQEGRVFLAEKLGFTLNDLNIFFKVSQRYYA